jgi:hypothetical protein
MAFSLYRRPALERRIIMLFSSWLRNWIRAAPAARRRAPTSARCFRPRLEALEDRWLPSGLPYPAAATVSQFIADINYVDQTGGAFTINLNPGTTFDLTSANNTTNGANGLPVIGGTKAVDLTIIGNGDTIERVSSTSSGHGKKQDNSSAFRLFDVAAGASLTLDDVTLKHGSAVGAVVYNQGTLRISYGTLSDNTGSDIYNAGGTAMVSNSTLSSGINNAGGTVTVSYSTLAGIANSAGTVTVSYSTLPSGGIDNASGTMTLSDSTVSGGAATDGGGIYNAGTLTVSNSTISGNNAAYGGGIYNAGGTVTLSDSTLSGNSANYGGAVYNAGGTLILSHSTITGNWASPDYSNRGGYGGGIYNDPAGTVTVQNSSSITGNASYVDYASFGPDVYNLGVLYLQITSSTIGSLDGYPAILI